MEHTVPRRVFIGGLQITPSKSWQIVEFSKKHLDQTAYIYAQGLLMEKPPGSTEPLDELTEGLRLHLKIYLLKQRKDRHIWLAFEGTSINGLLDFYHKPDELFIRFICAIPPHQGTGTRLLRHLAEYGQSHNLTTIRTTVSSIDLRALKFYCEHLGFQKVGTRTEEPGFELYVITIQPKVLLEKI
jgi:ribosomal protein S18 acetylase RimI-like enzyme